MQHVNALELKVYPNAERCSLWPAWCSVEFHDLVGPDKRLTDAELAAEYWKLTYGDEVARGWASDYAVIRRSEEQRQTMHRFATLPHYDEPTETGNKR